jgi:SAM-dependent methyltransferase
MSIELALLECPSCRSGGFNIDGGASNWLKCDHCTDRFEIRDDIACFLRQFDDYSENYKQICEDDLVEPKTPAEVKQMFTQLVQWRASGVTCDLGCGDGYVIERTDVSRKFVVDIAYPYLERLPSSIGRMWARVEEVPLKAGCIDTIICTDVLEHVLVAQLLTKEIDRLLSPDGRVLLAVPFEQDLSVYDLPEYKAKYAKYKYMHMRSIDDALIEELFPAFQVSFSHLITEGMKYMEFRPYPIKFYDLKRRTA